MPKNDAKPIVPKNATVEQAGLHLAAQLARGMRKNGKIGPDYQLYLDFFDSIQARTEEERLRDSRNASKNDALQEDRRLPRKDQSPTWYARVAALQSRRAGLDMRIRGLAEALNKGDAQKAKTVLSSLTKELGFFAQEYANYMASAGPELLNRHPELQRFTELWENGSFQEGKEVEQVLNSALEAASKEGESTLPEEERKPIAAEPAREEAPEDELEQNFNINEFQIEKERKKKAGERFQAHITHDVYSPGWHSYEGILGDCAEKARGAQRERLGRLLAIALTAAQFRRDGVPLDEIHIKNTAEDLEFSDGFAAMAQNTAYIKDVLSKPERINETLDTFLRERKLEQEGKPERQSYDEYLRRHTWPNVPEGREKEYLAKAIAAHRLASSGTPFDLNEIRSDAKLIEKQSSFKQMTEEESHRSKGEANVRRWLYRENLQPASQELALRRRYKIRVNQKEPQDRTIKSWAGYRRMHTGQNIPVNATPAQKRLYLAKAAIAVRGMADDQPFSVKAARKQAERLMKNKYFQAATKDPEKVSRILESGKITDIFEEMSTARRELLGRKKPAADVSVPSYQGRQNPDKQPTEPGSLGI